MKNPYFILIFLFFAFIFQLPVFSQALESFVDGEQAELYIVRDLENEHKTFLNTTIRIRPPKHFVEFSSEELSGFMHTGTAANIVGFQYPGTPYAANYEGFIESLKEVDPTVTFVGLEKVKTHKGFEGTLCFYTFKVEKVDIIRVILYTGDYNQMIFLQANYPAAFDMLIRQVIIQSLLSVEF
jgi:hypothetical protein